MNTDLCNVCGSSGTNLIDGFYYCVECGTQNENVRETMVEQKTLSDGTFAISHKKRIVQVPKKTIEMSAEWYKWHAYNFILFGLAEQLVDIGAKPTFKAKLLWIWIRYIKKFQNKAELGQVHESEEINQTMFIEEDVEENEESSCEEEPEENEKETTKKRKSLVEGTPKDIKIMTKGLLLSMLYLALNLDKSHIQLSHLYRYVRENRLNMRRLRVLVPEDIKVKNIPNWVNFMSSKVYPSHWTRAVAWWLLSKLDLGSPVVPDLRNIVDNLITELCLPNEFKSLVHSLMHFRSCIFLDIDIRKPSKYSLFLDRIPDYECEVMSYIVVALKMCFGLDGIYEKKLSDAVEMVNEEKGYPKSYKHGKFSNPTDRLFSFREWCSFLQSRKIMLCKYCLYMAEQHSLDIDDYVNMEHMEDRVQGKKRLPDEIAMDLLKKIPSDHNIGVIPKNDFVPSYTPMTMYTNIIKEHCQDPEVKLLLSEDYTQYSLKYACEDLELIHFDTSENVVTGVSDEMKTIHKGLIPRLLHGFNKKKVYVKNCESKYWMKTNRPTVEHITCAEEDEVKSKNSDHGYGSECTHNDKDTSASDDDKRSEACTDKEDITYRKDTTNSTDDDDDTREQHDYNESDLEQQENYKKPMIIKEENEEKSIFDDSFEYLDEVKDGDDDEEPNDECDVTNNIVEQKRNETLQEQFDDSDSDISCTSFNNFNPASFNREAIIKELVLAACMKYKIVIPKEYKEKPDIAFPHRRMIRQPGDTSFPKKKNKNPVAAKQQIEGLIDFYNNHVQGGLLDKLQQDVNAAIRQVNNTECALENNLEQSIAHTEQPQDVLNTTNRLVDEPPPINITEQTVTNNSNLPQMEGITEEVEAKLFEDEQMRLDDLMPKSEPKFDEKHHDVKQLYIKMNPVEVDEVLEKMEEDTELLGIINENVKKDVRSLRLPSLKKRKRQPSDSDDELPLIKIKEKLDIAKDLVEQEENLVPLIENRNVSDFKYWCRHYDAYKSMDQRDTFDRLLEDNTCLLFVFKECASVIDCSIYQLYKNVQRLENFISMHSTKLTD